MSIMDKFFDISRIVSFEILRVITITTNVTYSYWTQFWNWYIHPDDSIKNGPTMRYLLSDGIDLVPEMDVVPKNTVYVEEWYHATGEKRCIVRYEGEKIPTQWVGTPWTLSAKCPWVWVGDRDTEMDLTRTFNRYLVVGNHIRPALVEKLIHVNEHTNFVYIETGTFNELKFPGDGILIKAVENDE
jgi:hypothetical protein